MNWFESAKQRPVKWKSPEQNSPVSFTHFPPRSPQMPKLASPEAFRLIFKLHGGHFHPAWRG
jgi:hypothetical protein